MIFHLFKKDHSTTLGPFVILITLAKSTINNMSHPPMLPVQNENGQRPWTRIIQLASCHHHSVIAAYYNKSATRPTKYSNWNLYIIEQHTRNHAWSCWTTRPLSVIIAFPFFILYFKCLSVEYSLGLQTYGSLWPPCPARLEFVLLVCDHVV